MFGRVKKIYRDVYDPRPPEPIPFNVGNFPSSSESQSMPSLPNLGLAMPEEGSLAETRQQLDQFKVAQPPPVPEPATRPLVEDDRSQFDKSMEFIDQVLNRDTDPAASAARKQSAMNAAEAARAAAAGVPTLPEPTSLTDSQKLKTLGRRGGYTLPTRRYS